LIHAQWLGRLEYRWAWRLQHLRRDGVERGTAPEVLWTLEHDPVVTLGRRAAAVDVEALGGRHVPVVQTERGGLATWHGPGQLTGYLLVDIGRRGWAIKRVVEGIEAGLIGWLATQGVTAGRREGLHGVWVGNDKVGAIGLHVRRGVTMHGFALNLDPGPDAFTGIVPCGVQDGGVTSLARLTGQVLRAEQVADVVGSTVLDAIARANGARNGCDRVVDAI
jgi:lipoyl(octanoyl) transferase